MEAAASGKIHVAIWPQEDKKPLMELCIIKVIEASKKLLLLFDEEEEEEEELEEEWVETTEDNISNQFFINLSSACDCNLNKFNKFVLLFEEIISAGVIKTKPFRLNCWKTTLPLFVLSGVGSMSRHWINH